MPDLPSLLRHLPRLWANAVLRPALWLCLFVLAPLGVAYAQTQFPSGLSFTPPAGWKQISQDADTAIFGAPQDKAALVITSAFPVRDDPKALLEKMSQTLLEGESIVKQEPVHAQPSGEGGLYVKSLTIRKGGEETVRVFALLVRGGQASMLMLSARTEQDAEQALGALTGVLTSLRFTAVPAQSSAAAPATPAPAAPAPTFSGPAKPLPEVKPMNAGQFEAAGGDSFYQLIPDEFRCYRVRIGDGLTPELRVQVLPGGAYRTPYGSGQFKQKPNDTDFQAVGGPLDKAQGDIWRNDYGQTFKLEDVGPEKHEFKCYQRGPAENFVLFTFKLLTPKPGDYRCADEDGKAISQTLKLLPGNLYSLDEEQGRYRVSYRSDHDSEYSTVQFSGGPLDEKWVRYSEDEEGLRQVNFRSQDIYCTVKAKPIPWPSEYGTVKAPVPPKGSGGLSGYYSHSRYESPTTSVRYNWSNWNGGLDYVMTSVCPGNVCWEYRWFHKDGYYSSDLGTDGPPDCTRTMANGLPSCGIYRLSTAPGPVPKETDAVVTVRSSDQSRIYLNGYDFQRFPPLDGLRMDRTFTSFTYSAASQGSGGTSSQSRLVFTKQGEFMYDSSSATNLSGAGFALASGKTNPSQVGTYSFKGNVLELKFKDGTVRRLFAIIYPDGEGGLSFGTVRFGGTTYSGSK